MYLLDIYCVPDNIVGTGNIAEARATKSLTPSSIYSSGWGCVFVCLGYYDKVP